MQHPTIGDLLCWFLHVHTSGEAVTLERFAELLKEFRSKMPLHWHEQFYKQFPEFRAKYTQPGL